MPPKKQAQAGGSKMAEQKKKEKIIKDKTFGLKNKKGAKQQKFIKAVTHQVKFGQQNPRQVAQSEAEKKLKKDDKKKELQELNELFKPVVAAQKISKGADPKSVVCAFFKQGPCTKGDKSKFSHDLTLERKCEKRSVYIDARDEELEKDTMENWDEKKLEEIVNKKHGEAEQRKPKTQIVCKHFLEAIENNKYGWFCICPGGGDNCMYRHVLPPGFVLKKDKKKKKKKGERREISLEDLIERECSALGPNVTKITLESFLAWKKRKRQEKIDKLEQDMERRKADFKSGKALVISGREVFEFRPELVNDGDEEADDTPYIQGPGGDEVDDFISLYIPRAVDETGITVASLEIFNTFALDKDENKLSEASGGRAENGERSDLEEDNEGEGQENGAINAAPVDENLFTGEDLDELEEELNTLDLE
ncbi:LOW QUALITY PROTEIN: zinc finger CCCH domain-containing protein 15-like [Dipodomys spectabilis]|uniref:LOW QUALITY PROTEIN: zinc finger CCCH domain-containing protein 15-like n=1 Tax=Dipodomys spectabilis TaxID=105255 RepID=UPI001C53DF4E|nr:LOW QUALITY PROTEIN: zinc finger CCCH domain-containing protein 15-like [Dipodomys spectabilis]